MREEPLHMSSCSVKVDYARAQQMLKALLESGLISLSEFDKISELNRKFFSPMLADILPKTR